MTERVRFDEYGREIKPEKENSKGEKNSNEPQERMDPFEYERELRRREEMAYRKRMARWINPVLYASIACVAIEALALIIGMIMGGRVAVFGIPLVFIVLFGLIAFVGAVVSLALVRSAGIRARMQTKYALFVMLIAFIVWVFTIMVVMGVMG